MRKFLKEYHNPEEERMNFDLINRVDDGELVDYVIECCRSLEVLEYIKFKGYELITNEAEINTSEYIDQRSRGKKDSRSTKYMYMYDNRNAELRLTFDLTCGDEQETIVKKILIPIPDDDGYYTVKGNKYFLLWQIVDNSSYTTKKSLILKSMMPVIIKMEKYTSVSTSGEAFIAPTYTINIFRKDMDIMLFYLANGGIAWTLQYFSMDKITNFTTSVIDNKNYIYFQIHSKLFIEVNREFFMKYTYVKSVTFMILKILSNRVSIHDLFDKEYWIRTIGAIGTSNKNSQYDKGRKTMTFFNRIIDDTTKRILKLHPIHTKSIYSIIRWLVQNFEPLRRKDNLDLKNKRLRCNELITSSFI